MDSTNITEFDVVELPSRGIYYENKKKALKVSYLTAFDENILSSPNLANNSSVIEELLKRKILDKDININELVEEDRQAVLIFLRNTSFGSDYVFNIKDPKTDKEFSYTVDLSVLKMKDFNLEEDRNGEYSYFMEKSNNKIKFKFLTKEQQELVSKMRDNWNGNDVSPFKTKELELMIKSINDVRDPLTIRNMIEKLPIKDSLDFKKFVSENKPGLDLVKTIPAPSGENVQVRIGFGVEFFRPFYGI